MHYSELAQKYRVPAGFVVGLLFLFLCQPTEELIILGTAVSLLGLGLRFWAAGYLHKAQRLTVEGPYSYTRNPLYLGSFLMAVGFTLAGGSWIATVAVLFLFAAVYIPTVRREEIELRNGFHEEFDSYAAAVPRFFPRLRPFRAGREPFRLDQVWRNREYNSVLGCGIGLLMIYLKLWLFS